MAKLSGPLDTEGVKQSKSNARNAMFNLGKNMQIHKFAKIASYVPQKLANLGMNIKESQ